jgi:spermidine synthase
MEIGGGIIQKMRRAATVRTSHQELEVWKSDVATEFRVAGAIHASHHRHRFMTGLAWDIIAASAMLRPSGPPKSLLMLGLAGGTSLRALRHLLPECEFTAVDIDGEIVELAREHMDLDASGVCVHVADAYPWLAANRKRFDVVFDDIYLAGKTDVFRPRNLDSALMGHFKRAVAPGGLLAVNLVTGKGHRKMQLLTRKVLKEEFSAVRSLVTPGSMNEVLVAGESVAPASVIEATTDRFPNWRDRMCWGKIKLRYI